MKGKHITNLLDERGNDLSDADRVLVETHIVDCTACRRGYEAARVVKGLVQERAAVRTEASPFFQTRVLAAIRERQVTPEPFAFWRMWQAARTMVGALALAVAVLAGTTFFLRSPTPQGGNTMAASADASEQMLLGVAPEDVSDSQALAAIYEAGDETGGDNGNQ